MFLQKIWAFIKRDFFIWQSYRLLFLLNLLGIFISILTFYFISRLFGEGFSPYLQEYGGQYFPFVFIGVTLNGYLTMALQSFSFGIRREQMMGTLEAMLASPTSSTFIIICLGLWNFIFKAISILIYFLLGTFIFKIVFSYSSILSALVVLFLGIVSISSLGIISASFIIVFKRGDPLVWAIGGLYGFLGGAYFPIKMFPQKLQIISHFLPITYVLRALRFALLKGYPFNLLLHDILILLIFSLVLLPLSISIFRVAVKKAMTEGTLAHY